jgi:PAS domain S-box-containing protein
MTAEQIRGLVVSAANEIDRLETVLNSLTDGILVCDTNYNLILANKYARLLLPVNKEAGTEPLWRFIRDETLSEFFQVVLRSGDRIKEQEFEVERKGKLRLLSISVLPLVKDRHVSGSLVHVEDITEKRVREARMRRMESLASLTTLAAGVAHEIKNPLGSMSIHIQLMQKAMTANKELFLQSHSDEVDQDSQKYFASLEKYIAVVTEEIDRLNHIVVDFLFAVRPMDMDFHAGNINVLLEELMDFVAFELEAAHITYHLDLEEALPIIEFDDRYMKQVLLNLIKNAIAAMPDGGTLTITTQSHDAEVLLMVSDTGTGISEENLSKIFEPYFTTKETGSGLGLTLVYKIIREHKGEITVKSKASEGTSFVITLPIPQRDRRLISGPIEH